MCTITRHNDSRFSKGLMALCTSALLLLINACQEETTYRACSEEERDEVESQFSKASHLELMETLTDTMSTISLRQIVASRILASNMRHSSRFTEAIKQSHTTYHVAQDINDTIEMTRALNDLATNFRRVGAMGDATEYHYRALQLCDEFSDKNSYTARKNRTIAYNGIGNIDLTLHYFDEAKSYFALALGVEKALESDLGMAINYANIGSIFNYQQEYDSAYIYYCESMEHNRLANSVVGISLCYNAIGEIFEKRQMLDSARVSYEKSYDLLYNHQDRWHWLVSCLSLGRVEMLMGNDSRSKQLLEDAYKVAVEIDAPEQAESACLFLSEYEKKKQNYYRSLDYLTQARAFSARVQNERQNNSFLNTRVNYERVKGERELSILAAEKERKERYNRQIITVVSVIAFMLIIVILQFLQTLRIQRARNKELKEMNDMKDKLFSVISHDLKNPAIAMRNALHLLSTNGSSFSTDMLRKTYADLHKSAEVQVDLLNNLLNWTRLQMGRMQFEPSKIDIYGIVTDITELLALQASAKNISFQVSDKKGIMVFADNNMVSTIVRNIVSNAIKFSYTDGTISFDFSERAGKVALTIADQGVGMPQQKVRSILSDGHVRSTNGTGGEQGSGLVLAVCLDMARSNSGEIEIDSEEGRGATFRLILPKA